MAERVAASSSSQPQLVRTQDKDRTIKKTSTVRSWVFGWVGAAGCAALAYFGLTHSANDNVSEEGAYALISGAGIFGFIVGYRLGRHPKQITASSDNRHGDVSGRSADRVEELKDGASEDTKDTGRADGTPASSGALEENDKKAEFADEGADANRGKVADRENPEQGIRQQDAALADTKEVAHSPASQRGRVSAVRGAATPQPLPKSGSAFVNGYQEGDSDDD